MAHVLRSLLCTQASFFFQKKKSAMLIQHNLHSTVSDDLSLHEMCKVLFFLMGCQMKSYSSADHTHYQCSDSSDGVTWEISCYPDELIREDRNEKKKKKRRRLKWPIHFSAGKWSQYFFSPLASARAGSINSCRPP